jgi:hypothetical protein
VPLCVLGNVHEKTTERCRKATSPDNTVRFKIRPSETTHPLTGAFHASAEILQQQVR